VISSLTVSHLMLAWIGVLPLIALGVVDALGEDAARARRGQVLLAVALVVQFFLSTELLLLVALVTGVVLAILGLTALVNRRVPEGTWTRARRLVVPLGVAAVLLVVPATYALYGPRSLKGNIWGPGFNPDTGGTSFLDLVRPHAVNSYLTSLPGYTGKPVVQLQYLGWGLLLGAAGLAIWRWRDAVVRTAALTGLVCLVLSLSPYYVSWAPWQWIGRLPILQNVLQFRIVVFALLAASVVLARGLGALARRGRAGVAIGAVVLGGVVLPVAIPVAASLPLRTVHVAVPQWWRAADGPGVVLAYPYPGIVLQSPLTWQSKGTFPVSLLGGSGPQGTISRAGRDALATAILDDLSYPGSDRNVPGQTWPNRLRPHATPATAAPVRAMVARDGVTEVVVPVTLHSRFLVTGAPSPPAAAFFAQVLGLAPAVVDGAWVFHVPAVLPPPHFVSAPTAYRCAYTVAPSELAGCLGVPG